MKLITTLVLGLSTLFAAAEFVAPATVSKTESQVRWEASKVTGTHWGYVPLKNATLDYSGGKIKGRSFDMDMDNLTVEEKERVGAQVVQPVYLKPPHITLAKAGHPLLRGGKS